MWEEACKQYNKRQEKGLTILSSFSKTPSRALKFKGMEGTGQRSL